MVNGVTRNSRASGEGREPPLDDTVAFEEGEDRNATRAPTPGLVSQINWIAGLEVID